ncbi:MAG: archease [Mariprofundaceae bacterium]
MSESHWEHFHHGADIGVRGTGESLEEAFVQAARALSAVVASPDRILARQPVNIIANAPNPEILLVDWLNSLIFEMATRHMLFSRFDVNITGHRLIARAWGEAIDIRRHQPAVEVKGATCTGLRVARMEDGSWLAQCVVDV